MIKRGLVPLRERKRQEGRLFQGWATIREKVPSKKNRLGSEVIARKSPWRQKIGAGPERQLERKENGGFLIRDCNSMWAFVFRTWGKTGF